MTKKQKQQKDLVEFSEQFAHQLLDKDNDYIALSDGMKILVLSFVGAAVASTMQFCGVQPVKKTIHSTKNKKSADA